MKLYQLMSLFFSMEYIAVQFGCSSYPVKLVSVTTFMQIEGMEVASVYLASDGFIVLSVTDIRTSSVCEVCLRDILHAFTGRVVIEEATRATSAPVVCYSGLVPDMPIEKYIIMSSRPVSCIYQLDNSLHIVI